MAFGISATAWAAMATAAAAATSVYQGNEAQKAQKRAQQQAKTDADRTALDAERANNKANAKSPDTQAILDAALMSGKTGASGTMLTGPGGVDPGSLQLGRSTLLGG